MTHLGRHLGFQGDAPPQAVKKAPSSFELGAFLAWWIIRPSEAHSDVRLAFRWRALAARHARRTLAQEQAFYKEAAAVAVLRSAIRSVRPSPG